MLTCNRASVWFGATGSYVMDGDCWVGRANAPEYAEASRDLASWSAGVTVGYEYQIVKRLQVMCRIRGGVKEALKNQSFSKGKLFPLQVGITLSYDILRIGDCGCD